MHIRCFWHFISFKTGICILTLVMTGSQRCQPRRGGRGTPHPITLLKINSHAQNLACWSPRAFPIIPNLFHNFLSHTLPRGTPKNDPLEDVTKFGMKNMSKLFLTESIFITERLNFYLNFLRTSLNLGKKLHLYICLHFYGISGQSWLSLGVFFEKIVLWSHILL